MSKPILVANWKNHPDSVQRASTLLANLSKGSNVYKRVSTFIAPPYTYFESVSKRVKSFSNLASQDIFFLADGTHTGSVTPAILKSFGVRLSIIGHSERRTLGETNKIASDKIRSAFQAGITPLLCVGEIERDSDGEHFEFVREQLQLSLDGVRRKEDAKRLMIAYEPVWAIGKKAKDAMKPQEISEMVIFIRKVLTDIFGRQLAEHIPVLYGGSVESSNAKIIMESGVSGFLVGHASLDAKEFKAIAQALI